MIDWLSTAKHAFSLSELELDLAKNIIFTSEKIAMEYLTRAARYRSIVNYCIKRYDIQRIGLNRKQSQMN